MTYGDVKDAALQLINRYSIAGTKIASSYDNQADYLLRISPLVNDAQVYIATTGKKIPELVVLSALSMELHGQMYMVTLPENCWQPSGAGLLRFSASSGDGSPGYWRDKNYFVAGDRRLLIPVETVGGSDEIMVEYFRYPTRLPALPMDAAALDNTVEAQELVPYYVAAHLVLAEDAYAQAALYNEFETRLARLSDVPAVEYAEIRDVYDFFSL